MFDQEKQMSENTTTPEESTKKPVVPRFSIIVDKTVQEKVAAVAKEHKISQSEVIMTLYENADLEALKPKFDAKRETKVSTRGSKSALLARIGKLTPEQLEKLLSSVSQ